MRAGLSWISSGLGKHMADASPNRMGDSPPRPFQIALADDHQGPGSPGGPRPADPPPPPLDYGTACAEFGSAETMDEVLRWFLADTVERLPEMAKAAAAGDLDAVRAAAHRLVGSAATLEAAPLAEAARRLEHGAAKGLPVSASLTEVRDRFEALQAFVAAHAEEWRRSR
jgi:HPt (histidine-containing phosphotransfer) domain-containing protein